jgi:hypothetical protein
MTVLFIDGFRQYTNLSQRYDSYQGGFLRSTGGPTGGGYLLFNDMGNCLVSCSARKILTPSSTWYLGARFLTGGAPHAGFMFRLYSGLTEQANVYVDTNLLITSTGHSSDYPVSADVWHWIEARITIGTANGTVEVRVDGVTVLTATGLNTNPASSGTADSVGFSQGGGFFAYSSLYLTDYYAADGAGGQSFYGDMRVETLVPTSAGANSGWTPTSGYGYECVDELPGNETDYVHALVTGLKDTYVYGNLSIANGTVIAVQHSIFSKRSDAGTRYYAPVTRLTNTDYVGPAIAVQSDWSVGTYLQTVNPATSNPWTIANVNDAEFGMAVVNP